MSLSSERKVTIVRRIVDMMMVMTFDNNDISDISFFCLRVVAANRSFSIPSLSKRSPQNHPQNHPQPNPHFQEEGVQSQRASAILTNAFF